ncbi:MAG: hypothetical protein AAGG09_04400 [Pseudomonadota bacterium]
MNALPPSPADGPPEVAEDGAGRRPRIAIMGEFSAGKSTLTNLLLGGSALPTRITATQLPPVWVSLGDGASYAETVDGARFAVDLADPDGLDLTSTRFLRVFLKAEILEVCDLIDFPGISDPNMDAEVWRRLVPLADAVLWCTHATQAWRQTEAAVWDEVPFKLHERSLLLLTRMDRLTEERDRRKVIARVTRETDGLFAGVYPVSLTRGLAAGSDRAAWEDSGAAAMTDALVDLVGRLSKSLGRDTGMPERFAPRAPERVPETGDAGQGPDRPPADVAEPSHAAGRVMPKRVRPEAAGGRRPPSDGGAPAPSI